MSWRVCSTPGCPNLIETPARKCDACLRTQRDRTRHTYTSLCDRAGVNKDILKRAVGHTPKSKTLDEVYLHLKANQMIEAFDKADQLVKDEVLALPEE